MRAHGDNADALLTRTEAAKFLGRTRQTLRLWASKGCGPRFHLVDGRAFYRLDDLRRFVDPFALPEKLK